MPLGLDKTTSAVCSAVNVQLEWMIIVQFLKPFQLFEAHQTEGLFFTRLGDGHAKLVAVSSSEAFSDILASALTVAYQV